MDDHEPIDQPGVLEHPAHHSGVADRPAVIAEGDRARIAQRDHLGHHLALEAAGRGRDGMDARGRLLARPVDDELGHGGVVVHGIGIRHAGNRGEPAGHCRAASGGKILLVLLAGLAQVTVHVDESWSDPAIRGIYDLGTPSVEIQPDGRHQPFIEQHVGSLVATALRVEHATASDADPLHDQTVPPPEACPEIR